MINFDDLDNLPFNTGNTPGMTFREVILWAAKTCPVVLADTLEKIRSAAEDKWISVEDKVPALGEVVVAISIGTHYPAAIATWETGHGFESIGFGDKRTLWKVTHWMPLPSPPTAKVKKTQEGI